jgi:hypothetical protein
MSDINGAGAAADQAAADLETTEANDQTFPEWEKAFDDNGIPDLLRPGLRDVARKQNAAAQSAIEKARGGGVAPEWQALVGDATAGGVNPQDLYDAWNAAQAIRADPAGFARDLNARITELESSGQITAAQATAARAEGSAAIVDAQAGGGVDLKTPELQRIEALEQRLENQLTQQQQQQQAFEEQQIQQEALSYAETFRTELYGQLETAGYTVEAGTLNNQVIDVVGRVAASALEGDQTGTLTPQQAVTTAMQALISISGGPKPIAQVPAQQQQQQFPIGGGRGGVAAEQKPVFGQDRAGRQAENKWRSEAMLAEAQRLMSAGE